MKEIRKLGLILLVITAIAAAALGYVNMITKGPIAEQNRLADIAARKQVLPQAEDFEQLDVKSPGNYLIIKEIYKGLQGGKDIGYTIKTVPNGYGGPVEVMIGISSDGTIIGVNIGNHTETPGLGAKATDEAFKGQYTNKTADMNIKVIKSGTPSDDQISAIAGSTITSVAVTDGVNEAIKYFNENLR
mgnify:CR=1 FL=1